MQNWLFLCYYSVQSIASFTYPLMFSENHELSSHILYKAHIGGAWFSAKSHQLQAEHYKRKTLKMSKHYKVKIFSTLYMGFLFYCKIWCADARDLENTAWTKFVTQENFSEKEKRSHWNKIKLQEKLDQRKGKARKREEKWNSKVKHQVWDCFCQCSFISLVHFSAGHSSCHSCTRSYNRNNQI